MVSPGSWCFGACVFSAYRGSEFEIASSYLTLLGHQRFSHILGGRSCLQDPHLSKRNNTASPDMRVSPALVLGLLSGPGKYVKDLVALMDTPQLKLPTVTMIVRSDCIGIDGFCQLVEYRKDEQRLNRTHAMYYNEVHADLARVGRSIGRGPGSWQTGAWT
jgi:hypothetical protein